MDSRRAGDVRAIHACIRVYNPVGAKLGFYVRIEPSEA